AVLAEYLRLSAADAIRLFPGAATRAARPCPGCGAAEATPAFTKNRFDLVNCRSCGTLYVNPAPRSEPLAALYRDSESSAYWARVFFPTVAGPRRMKVFRPRVERALALLKARGETAASVTDVGAGAGIFLEEFRKLSSGVRTMAVEPSTELADQCRQKGL